MNQPPQVDPISMVVTIAGILFAQEVAAVVGPYLVIVFASTIGASFALAARPSAPLISSLWFFLRVNGLSVLLTYFVATAVHSRYPIGGEQAWFAPVAFVIGFIGDRWPAVLMWAARKVSKLVDVLIKMRGGDGGNNG